FVLAQRAVFGQKSRKVAHGLEVFRHGDHPMPRATGWRGSPQRVCGFSPPHGARSKVAARWAFHLGVPRRDGWGPAGYGTPRSSALRACSRHFWTPRRAANAPTMALTHHTTMAAYANAGDRFPIEAPSAV